MIHRRHVLGLVAAASALPSCALAKVPYQKSEIRGALAKHFAADVWEVMWMDAAALARGAGA